MVQYGLIIVFLNMLLTAVVVLCRNHCSSVSVSLKSWLFWKFERKLVKDQNDSIAAKSYWRENKITPTRVFAGHRLPCKDQDLKWRLDVPVGLVVSADRTHILTLWDTTATLRFVSIVPTVFWFDWSESLSSSSLFSLTLFLWGEKERDIFIELLLSAA